MKIFIKTLKEEFFITVIFSILLAAGIYLVIQEYAVARHLDFSYITDKVPEPVRKMTNAFLVINIFSGYLHIVASVAWIMIGSVWVCLIFSGLISREAEQKTLGLLMSHPVGRVGVLLEKYLAGVLYTIILVFCAYAGFYTGTYHGIVDVPYSPQRFIYVSINGLMYFIALSSVATFFSVIFREHKKSAITSMLFFLLSYLSFFLGAFSLKWEKVKSYTLFKYFDTEKLFLAAKFQWQNCLALLIITVIMLSLSAVIFIRKDLET